MKRIRVGVGGWTFAGWRDNFYPKKLPHKDELAYASTKLTMIEINGTFYRNQTPKSFQKWHAETPDDFLFSVKASRFVTNRKDLTEAGGSIERFFASGLDALGDKLGPILWQLAPFKRFKPEEIDAFFALLPKDVKGRPLRHVLDPRHDSFRCEEYIAIAREHGVATVFNDSDEHPSFADRTADFVYARLMRCQAEESHGYPDAALTQWVENLRMWSNGGEPTLPRVGAATERSTPTDVLALVISGAKERAPAAAQELLRRLAMK